LRLPLFIVATMVAASRINLGAHYPGDVLVGGMLGLLLGAVMVRAFKVKPADPDPHAKSELVG
jgi:membrane-associated phospholipid phosphatase